MERILVIEDDLAVQRALRRTFELAGFDVTAAADGAVALETFRATLPDIIVLDLRLPGKSGQDICREIKREASNLPILVLSAANDVLDKVLLLELGADDYVTKPFSPRELLARVRAAFRRLNQAAVNVEVFSFERRRSKLLQVGVVPKRATGAAHSAGVQDVALLPEQPEPGSLAYRAAQRSMGLQQLSRSEE